MHRMRKYSRYHRLSTLAMLMMYSTYTRYGLDHSTHKLLLNIEFISKQVLWANKWCKIKTRGDETSGRKRKVDNFWLSKALVIIWSVFWYKHFLALSGATPIISDKTAVNMGQSWWSMGPCHHNATTARMYDVLCCKQFHTALASFVT